MVTPLARLGPITPCHEAAKIAELPKIQPEKVAVCRPSLPTRLRNVSDGQHVGLASAARSAHITTPALVSQPTIIVQRCALLHSNSHPTY